MFEAAVWRSRHDEVLATLEEARKLMSQVINHVGFDTPGDESDRLRREMIMLDDRIRGHLGYRRD